VNTRPLSAKGDLSQAVSGDPLPIIQKDGFLREVEEERRTTPHVRSRADHELGNRVPPRGSPLPPDYRQAIGVHAGGDPGLFLGRHRIFRHCDRVDIALGPVRPARVGPEQRHRHQAVSRHAVHGAERQSQDVPDRTGFRPPGPAGRELGQAGQRPEQYVPGAVGTNAPPPTTSRASTTFKWARGRRRTLSASRERNGAKPNRCCRRACDSSSGMRTMTKSATYSGPAKSSAASHLPRSALPGETGPTR
jgi:hypothetical protein